MRQETISPSTIIILNFNFYTTFNIKNKTKFYTPNELKRKSSEPTWVHIQYLFLIRLSAVGGKRSEGRHLVPFWNGTSSEEKRNTATKQPAR